MSQVLTAATPPGRRQALEAGIVRIVEPSIPRAAYIARKTWQLRNLTADQVVKREIDRAFSSGKAMREAVKEARKYPKGHGHAREIEREKRRSAAT